MASIFASKVDARRLPLSTATALIGVAGVAYFATRRPFYCDAPSLSNGRMPTKEMTKTLSFPYNMLSSRHLTSPNVEQVNHDTKKITFLILGEDGEVGGVPGGGAFRAWHTEHETNRTDRRNSHPTHADRAFLPSSTLLSVMNAFVLGHPSSKFRQQHGSP
jgi:hypothetical protein